MPTSILIINGTLFIIVVFLLLFLSMIWPPDSPWAPWWRTNTRNAIAAGKLAGIASGDTVYELGSGDGEFLITAVNRFKAKKAVGIEIDPLRAFISRLRLRTHKLTQKACIMKGNFFDFSISEATVVFMYLVPKALERLKPKLLQELAPGTRIVSFRYPMNLPLIETDKGHELYLYTIPSRPAGSRKKKQ